MNDITGVTTWEHPLDEHFRCGGGAAQRLLIGQPVAFLLPRPDAQPSPPPRRALYVQMSGEKEAAAMRVRLADVRREAKQRAEARRVGFSVDSAGARARGGARWSDSTMEESFYTAAGTDMDDTRTTFADSMATSKVRCAGHGRVQLAEQCHAARAPGPVGGGGGKGVVATACPA